MENVKPKQRQSNFELLRIICMLMIMALHYYNLGVQLDYSVPADLNSHFIRFFGFGGNAGVDMFVLIGSYFLVAQKFRPLKAVQIIFQCGMATGICAFIAYCIGDVAFKEVIRGFLSALFNYHWFVTAYLLLYIFSDYLNLLIRSMTKKQHLTLVSLMLCVCSVLPTLFGMRMNSSSLFLFVTLYFIAGYIRFYPPKLPEGRRVLLIGIAMQLGCFIVSALLYQFKDVHPIFLTVSDRLSAKDDLTLIIYSVVIFCGFRNLDIGYRPIINKLGACTFGVYLLHMNPYLYSYQWSDILRTPQVFHTPLLFIHAPVSVILLFLVYSGVDIVYRRFIQEPVMGWVGRHWDGWTDRLGRCVRRLLP